MFEFKGKTVLVFGSVKSGIGAATLLDAKGAATILYDGNENLNAKDIKERLPEYAKTQILLGELPEEVMDTLDLVVMSP